MSKPIPPQKIDNRFKPRYQSKFNCIENLLKVSIDIEYGDHSIANRTLMKPVTWKIKRAYPFFKRVLFFSYWQLLGIDLFFREYTRAESLIIDHCWWSPNRRSLHDVPTKAVLERTRPRLERRSEGKATTSEIQIKKKQLRRNWISEGMSPHRSMMLAAKDNQ